MAPTWGIIVTAVGLASVLPIYGQQKSAVVHTQQKSADKPAESPTPAAASTVIVINQNASDQNSDGAANRPKSYLSRLFSPENLPNVALVVIGVVASIIAVCTLRFISDQARSGRDAARAALLSAQSMIDVERPWFVVSIERTKPQFDFWRVRITNKGRTPGQLWEVFADRIFVDAPDSLPQPPKYSSPTYAPDTRFFANEDSFTVRENSIDGFLPKEIWEQDSKTRLNFLVVYGKVTYKDTFTGGRDNEVLHETRWCYLWQGPQDRFVPCGPAEYNGYRDYSKGQNHYSKGQNPI